VHLALTARGRSRQLERLRQRIERLVPSHAPLIVAGDFNDWHWRYKATHELAHPLNMHEVFELLKGMPARSFPAMLRCSGSTAFTYAAFASPRARAPWPVWGRISDHAALTTTLEPL
jgi:endonuclease/exonuclease/phosphatase family metal-dependent hydrolase